MSREEQEQHAIERSEYMRNVKWTTGIYLLGSTVSIVLAVAGVYWGLKGDIKDNRQEAKSQIQNVYYRLDKKMDSLQSSNERHFDLIDNRFDNLPASKTVIVRSKPVGAAVGYFTQRWVDGKLGFFPVK